MAVKDLKIGYAYELPLSYNYQLSSGTHEISFSMDFQFLKSKTIHFREKIEIEPTKSLLLS